MISRFKQFLAPPLFGESREMEFWRDKILQVILVAGLIIAFFALIPAAIMAAKEEVWLVFFLDIGMYVAGIFILVSRRLDFRFRAITTVLLIYIIGFYIICLFGLLSGGAFCLFTFSVLAGLLLGLRAATLALFVNGVTLVSFGWLHIYGTWGQNLPFFPTILRGWVAWATFMLMNVISSFSAASMIGGMQYMAEKEQAANRDLRAERHKLVREIEEREKAETALRESESRYRLLAENVTDVIWTYSLEEERITYVSPSVFAAMGFTPEEVMEQSFHDILTPVSAAIAFKAIAAGLERDSQPGISLRRSRTLELQQKNKNGSITWAEVTTSFIRDENGKAMGLVGVARNIEARKTAEEERVRLEQRLQEVQKMEAIGTLTGGVAHDFNNILGVMLGHADLLLYDSDQSKSNYFNLMEIKKAGLRARDIISQLLRYSRKEGRILTPLDIVPVVRDSLSLLRSTLSSKVTVHADIIENKAVVMADATQLNQAITNLCINASQAMESTGGMLEVSLKITILENGDPKLAPDMGGGKFVQLIISDTGPGISPEHLDRIFDPYFTTKEVGEGSGLGLAVVQGIVKNHGGLIFVDSSPGHGTAFTLYFPLSQKDLPEVGHREESPDLPYGTESILFVDDEDSMVGMATHMLGRLGYKVTAYTSPMNALSTFQDNPEAFDLVMTDMSMPEMSGVDFYNKVRKVDQNIPVIICTGHSTQINQKKALALGMAAYITKPMSMFGIAEVLRKVLDNQ